MPIDVHPARQGRRPEQIIAEQKARAVRANAQKTVAATAVMPPTKTNSTAVATPVLDTRTTAQKYVDEIAPASYCRQAHQVRQGRHVCHRRRRRKMLD